MLHMNKLCQERQYSISVVYAQLKAEILIRQESHRGFVSLMCEKKEVTEPLCSNFLCLCLFSRSFSDVFIFQFSLLGLEIHSLGRWGMTWLEGGRVLLVLNALYYNLWLLFSSRMGGHYKEECEFTFWGQIAAILVPRC